ncbi:MAG: Holliday junction branch migration protein RuvA [Longimonas sp.]|uniref:Holliday junction branch migration protein RuvA n=1 Tax=Longimonas sp. TaxID=2039626 RepID=UPI003975EA9E
MITYVSGTLVEKTPEEAVVDVDGLGYAIAIPSSTFQELPDTGESVHLYTVHYVREDDISLYGFATKVERTLFNTMRGVSRVGPSLALSALSAMSPRALRDHVLNGDTARLKEISGVGRKTAERLIVELRDPLSEMDLGGSRAVSSGSSDAKAAARADALAALESLGLSRADAERAIRIVLRDNADIDSADALVRKALKVDR